jgi:hypothetical protein
MLHWMRRFSLAAVLAVLGTVLATGAAASSPPNREQVRYNPADQAAARAAILRRGDLGSGWSGGARKPDPPSVINCPGYEPKQTDLVLTGAAEAIFQHGGLLLQSDAQVLKTRAMVAKDWKRSVTDPRALPCLRYIFTKQFPSNWRLVSFRRIAFPRLAKYAAAYRMLIRVRAQGQSLRILLDQVFVGRSRTELTLTASAPAAARATISAAEVRAARILVARVRA